MGIYDTLCPNQLEYNVHDFRKQNAKQPMEGIKGRVISTAINGTTQKHVVGCFRIELNHLSMSGSF